MPKIVKDESGLTPQQAAFAQGLARGLSQADSYRQSYQVQAETKPESVYCSASRLAQNPYVQARVRELLKEARIADVDSVGEAWRTLLDAMAECRDDKNWNALASMLRIRLQGLGALKNDTTLTIQSQMTDDEIIRRLAKDDEKAAAMLKSIVTADSFETTQH